MIGVHRRSLELAVRLLFEDDVEAILEWLNKP